MDNGINPNITYKKEKNALLYKESIKIILIYIFELLLWIYIVRIYANLGIKIIVPAVSAMWVFGAFTGWQVKEEREATIKSTKLTILGYLAFLFVYRIAIQYLDGISSTEIASALSISVTTTSGIAIASWLNNILLFTSVMTPLGYLIWCAKKFTIFQGRESKSDAFKRIKDIRNNMKK